MASKELVVDNVSGGLCYSGVMTGPARHTPRLPALPRVQNLVHTIQFLASGPGVCGLGVLGSCQQRLNASWLRRLPPSGVASSRVAEIRNQSFTPSLNSHTKQPAAPRPPQPSC